MVGAVGFGKPASCGKLQPTRGSSPRVAFQCFWNPRRFLTCAAAFRLAASNRFAVRSRLRYSPKWCAGRESNPQIPQFEGGECAVPLPARKPRDVTRGCGADWESRTPVPCMASKRLEPLDEICMVRRVGVEPTSSRF
jgi:hypothetical protein